MKHIWDLLIKIYLIVLIFNTTVIYAFPESLLLINERVCSSIDIRKQSHLTQLNDCTVIEGDLYIVTVTFVQDQTFPLLKEITGSLVIYYAMGIKSLETYFPNLILIRGQTLAYNYAVVIKETSLLYIGLINLRLILFGGIRIDTNPLLCYTSSINWPSIVKQPGASIKTINMRNICPDFCPKNCSQSLSFSSHSREYCWSHKTCQNICSSKCTNKNLCCFMNDPNKCCHSECLAGCFGYGEDKCVSCKNVMFHGRCFEKCPDYYYKYKNRRCISKSECTKMSSQSSTDYRRRDFYAIEDDSCVKQCSIGKERDISSGQCVVCGFNCSKKYCGKVLIHSINDLTEVDGCYSIEEININIIEGGSSLSELLSKAFSKLTVIDNSLEIIRSSSITSLSFLKSLKLIKGNVARKNAQKNDTSENLNKSIVFKVYDNENLVEISNDKLAEEKLNITILHGSVSFNLNRKLCPEKILSFLKNNIHSQVEITTLDEKIINISNGDMAFCKHEKLNVTIKAISHSSFIVECKSKITDFLLQDSGSAALFILKETEKNVSQYELFNSCFKQNWRTIEGTLGKPVLIDGLKPAKRYAFYVEAIRSRVENWLEISDVIYITTERKKPSPPIDLKAGALSHNEIKLTWSSPLFPNGVVTHYLIWFRSFEIYHKEFLLDDFCPYKRYFQKHSSWTEKKSDASPKNEANSHNICDCNSCVTLCNQDQLKRNFDRDTFDFQLFDHYISQSFQKQNSIPTSNWVPRVSDDIEIKNLTTKEYNNTEDTNVFFTQRRSTIPTWSFPQNSVNQPVQMIRVSAGVSFYIFTNLHHYTEYLFEIQACQDPVDNEPLKIENYSYSANKKHVLKHVCSSKSSVSAHTFPKEHMDDINETMISSLVIGNTVKIIWTEPSAPNGLILNFLLRYRDIPCENRDNWLDQLCITRVEWLNEKEVMLNESHSFNKTFSSLGELMLTVQRNGLFVIKNLRPGTYEYQIKSISIPGNGSWTKSFYFTIPHNSVFKSYQPLFIAGSIVIVLFLIATICFVYYYHRKRQLARTNWISTNPDYWIIYEIDEWEIDRKDIDMIEWNYPLGRGSFGIVYKGILKNLTTPVRHQVFDVSSKKDMYVAIKTLNANSTILERREFINEACYMKQFQTYHLVKLFGIVSKISQSENNKRLSSKSLFCHRFSLIGRIRHAISWDRIKKINIFKYGESKSKKPGDLLEDKSAAQLISFKSTISQHFQKMPLVIMELMEYGDLAGYLRKQGEEGEGFISENQTCLWALQIADGMLYLSETKFVHRDLAARNCMINSSLIIKIGDFGMARDIYYDCYYKKEGKGRLPIRWMAPESLESAYFTTNSDVWSYGVVLWEISTLASLPYLGMSHHEVIQFVTNGGTLLTNGGFSCPKIIWNIVECCWLNYADKRPTFFEITQKLEPYSDHDFQTNSYYFKQKNSHKPNMNLNLLSTQTDTDNSIENYFHKS